MRTLLRIDASIRSRGSHSRALGDYFQKRWRESCPGGRVVVRDLAAAPAPHLNYATMAAFTGMGGGDADKTSSVEVSDALIAELEAADEVLVTAPVYNFNTPSTLKAYVDHVVRFGRTLSLNEGGFHGLLRGKSACIVTARGGVDPGQADCQGPFLQAAFHYLGFDRVEWIALEGTAMGGTHLTSAVERAKRQVDEWFDPLQATDDGIEWRGIFSAQDRAEIQALRTAQVRAILDGDAAACAALCTDDVVLMLEGRKRIEGRVAFLECDTALFRAACFISLRPLPARVEREGALAVETGCQESLAERAAAEAAKDRARRNYTHILRKTASGWRFAVLMSNNSL